MKLRVVAIILLFSLLLFFGFKKVSANKNNEQSTNIEQLHILKYIPEDNKLLFISNLDSFNIFSCSIFVLCSLFLFVENFLKPKKSNRDNNIIIVKILSFIINVYFYF